MLSMQFKWRDERTSFHRLLFFQIRLESHFPCTHALFHLDRYQSIKLLSELVAGLIQSGKDTNPPLLAYMEEQECNFV